MTGSADRNASGGSEWPSGEYPLPPRTAEEEWQQQGHYTEYTDPGQAPGVPRQYAPETSQQQGQYGYDTGQHAAYGYDTGQYPQQYGYDTGQYQAQQPYPQQYAPGTGYDTGQYQAYGYQQQGQTGGPYTGGEGYDTGQQPVVSAPAAPTVPAPTPEPQAPQTPGDKGNYQTEEFAFVDDEEEESQDVIDWLKFSETRGERQAERRRKLRGRLTALLVVLVIAAGGGVGYLFVSGKLSLGGSSGSGGAVAVTQRQVIAVYLRNHTSGQTASVLLVSDPGTGKATTVLVPETLSLPQTAGGAAVKLGDSWEGQGTTGTMDGLNSVLGTGITGTWRLDDSFLATLVDVLGGITVNADTAITVSGKQVVTVGSQTMNGSAAEAYATYQAKGEARSAQLARFGQVMEAMAKAFPTDTISATADVDRMGAVLDPSLPEKQLGTMLASIATYAAKGNYSTVTLPVSSNGSLAGGATAVLPLLGGKASAAASASGKG